MYPSKTKTLRMPPIYESPHLPESVLIRDNKRSVSCFLGKLIFYSESRAVLGAPASRRLDFTINPIFSSKFAKAAAISRLIWEFPIFAHVIRRDAGASRMARYMALIGYSEKL
jgi:hypothetical protein